MTRKRKLTKIELTSNVLLIYPILNVVEPNSNTFLTVEQTYFQLTHPSESLIAS